MRIRTLPGVHGLKGKARGFKNISRPRQLLQLYLEVLGLDIFSIVRGLEEILEQFII
jgi:hypothetical protein